MLTAPSVLFEPLLVSFFSYLSILLHTWLFLTLCPVTILIFVFQLTFCIPYQMLLTTLFRKHMYSYISENNFGPSNQIIVPIGYNFLLYYLLTPWCRVLLEKLTGLQLVKKFPAFHGTRKFIIALTSVRIYNILTIYIMHVKHISY